METYRIQVVVKKADLGLIRKAAEKKSLPMSAYCRMAAKQQAILDLEAEQGPLFGEDEDT